MRAAAGGCASANQFSALLTVCAYFDLLAQSIAIWNCVGTLDAPIWSWHSVCVSITTGTLQSFWLWFAFRWL